MPSYLESVTSCNIIREHNVAVMLDENLAIMKIKICSSSGTRALGSILSMVRSNKDIGYT